LQSLKRSHPPADNLGRQGVILLLAVQRVGEPANVLLDLLEMPAEVCVQTRVEALVEYLLYNPARDNGTPDGRHLLLARLERLGTDVPINPVGQDSPILADVERKIVDRTVESVESRCVFAVIERRAGCRNSLVGNRILKLLDLAAEPFNLRLAVKI
jgi:hypothetical protein